MTKKVLCMGSVNVDMVMYMDHAPIMGETVVTDNFHTFSGGKGGNQAATVGKLGADVKMFTKLGDDSFSKLLMEDLQRNNVDIGDVLIEKGQTSGVAMIRVDASGQNSISFTSGANGKLCPQDVRDNSNVFDGCDILLITMEIDTSTVYEAIKIAKQKGMTVVVDPAPAPAGGIPSDIAELIDYIKPNETEAEILSGVTVRDRVSAIRALQKLREIGFRTPVLTLAGQGALTWNAGRVYRVEPLIVDSVDSTAAGDIFLGAFVAALAREKEFVQCVEYAKTVAAISTTKKGAQASIPEADEIEACLEAEGRR